MAPQGPVSLVSVLDKTPYDDTESEKSLEVISVQLKILSWLGSNAATDLTTTTARRWTEQLIPGHQTATPKQALELCYYMRTLGFNTFSRLNSDYLLLYIADKNEYQRSARWDVVYWRQNIRVGTVTEPRQGTIPPRHRRRNAISGPSMPEPPNFRGQANRGPVFPAQLPIRGPPNPHPAFAGLAPPVPQAPDTPLLDLFDDNAGEGPAGNVFGNVNWDGDNQEN